MSEEKDNPQWGGKEYEGGGPNLRFDDFVGRIVQDPKAPPSVTLLSGYLGSSSEEGHVRLYLDEELCRYVEIPEKAIRHTQELPPEQSPLGGSLVWIDRDAEVLHGAAGSERRKATFLEGQIAQDYIGGGGGGYDQSIVTRTADCGGGFGGGGSILPTDMGPGCGQSQCGPCIPPTEQVYCRTLTGIACTRFGPGCRRTVFEPSCTSFGPNCRTVLVNQCQSVYTPCFTQNKYDCVESGFVGCNPPIDFTIYEQYGQQQFARQAGGGKAPATMTMPTLCELCVVQTQTPDCGATLTPFCAVTTRTPNCGVALGGNVASQLCVSQAVRCPSAVDACPTRFNCPSAVDACPSRLCPSRSTPCQSQLNRCQSQLDACPTRFNCPSVSSPCVTQDFSCSTRAACPSAVDACPTRFGCYETQVCGYGGSF